MRLRFFSLLLIAATFAFGQAPAAPAAPAPSPAVKPWDKIAFPKLHDLKVPAVKKYTLPNGLRLFLLEDHTLPIIDGLAMIRTGSRWVQSDKTGLAGVFGSVLRNGGTKTRTGDQIDEQLEAIAGSVESSIGQASGSASFSAQKGDIDTVLAVYADMLMNPEFRQDKIDLAKVGSRTAIARRNDEPADIASREFRKIVYGADSPYATQAELWTVDAITRADLVAFHQRYYHPNNIMLAVWGDFDTESMKTKIEKALGGWPSAKLDLPPVPQADPNLKPTISLVKKEDVNQSNIRIGHAAGRLDDPDFFAADVMATVLCSGGFSSRMTRHIRSEMGLAYGASGDWSAGYDHDGMFYVAVGTKSESTTKAIEAVLKEIRDIREKEVTDEELKIAKESILNNFIFNFEEVGQVIGRVMTYEYYGYPADFLEKYRNNVEKVTKADVLKVAQRRLQPASLGVLVVGKDTDFDKPLTTLAYAGGQVKTVDVAIHETKPAAAASAGPGPGGRPGAGAGGGGQGAGAGAALQVIGRALKFFGGMDNIKAVKDLDTKGKLSVSTPQGEFDLEVHAVAVLPAIVRTDIDSPFGQIANYFDGTNGWGMAPGQSPTDLPEEQKKDAREGNFHQLLNLLSGYGSPSVVLEKKDGDNDVLLVTQGEMTMRVAVDPAGKVVKRTYHVSGPLGTGEAEETISDYRAVGGIQYPFKTVITLNGQKYLDITLTEVKTNTSPDLAKLAEKPK
jgi:zinc protease